MSDIKIYRLIKKIETEYTDASYEDFLFEGSILDGISKVLSSVDTNIIGIISNDYFFTRGEIPLDEYAINGIMDKYDVIIPYSGTVSTDSIDSLLHNSIQNQDTYNIIRECITDEYVSAYDTVCKSTLLSEGCLCIAHKEIIVAMYTWILDIINQLENIGMVEEPPTAFSDENKTLLVAVLTRVWLMSNRYKVCEYNYSKAKADKFVQAEEKISLLQNYVDIRLRELVELRESSGFKESLAEPMECADDFGGMIPVWICWWQGENDMPELIRACIDSLKRNLPDDLAEIRMITLENVFEYVTLTENIIDKFNNGIISYTHLSDALRAELLYRYGGMWIDATIYVSAPIDRNLFMNSELFTIAFERPLWGLDIMRGRWTTSLWIVPPKHMAMQFLMEGLWIYWDYENAPIDYFFMDYIIDCGYRNFEGIRNAIDGSKKSSDAVYGLQLRLGQAFTPEEYKHLIEDSCFYKINRRYEYSKVNSFGQKTIYGYLLEPAEPSYIDCSFSTIEISTKSQKFIDLGETDCARLLKLFREVNPSKVLDVAGIFSELGMISRMTVNETSPFGIHMDTVKPEGEMYPVYENIYDKVLDIMPKDISYYDLIIWE